VQKNLEKKIEKRLNDLIPIKYGRKKNIFTKHHFICSLVMPLFLRLMPFLKFIRKTYHIEL